MEYILLIIALFVLLETSFLTYQQLRRNTKRTSTAIYVDTSVLITFIAVSHDRYFLDKTANCTLELKDGRITEYLGNYSYYLMAPTTTSEREHAMGWM